MKTYKYLSLLTILYVTFQLVSDITAGKIVQLGIFTVSVTALYFPFTFIFGDVLTEVYGYAKARNVVWKVLLASILAGIIYQIVILLPPAEGFTNNNAYTTVLGSVPRILLGGWLAVWAGAMINDYVMAKMKVFTKGKYLWTRTISSTIVSELVNSILFYTIALYAILPNGLLVTSILSAWVLKVLVEVVLTPLTYIVVKKLKKEEQEDYFDTDTDFNPLLIK